MRFTGPISWSSMSTMLTRVSLLASSGGVALSFARLQSFDEGWRSTPFVCRETGRETDRETGRVSMIIDAPLKRWPPVSAISLGGRGGWPSRSLKKLVMCAYCFCFLSISSAISSLKERSSSDSSSDLPSQSFTTP